MDKKPTKFDKAVKEARTPKGKKKLEARLKVLRDEESAIYTIQEHARTENHLASAKKYAEETY